MKALAAKETSLRQGELSGWAMSIFIAGWATGGLIFGAVGDRIGRAKTLALTVLLYSVFTGLSSFAANIGQFMIYRALTGLGVGGVFGLAVALVADALPESARPKALGMLQALSAVGNVTAGVCAMSLSGVDPRVVEIPFLDRLRARIPLHLHHDPAEGAGKMARRESHEQN